MKHKHYPLAGSATLLAVAVFFTGCDGKIESTAKNERETNASVSYVAPG